MCLPGKQTGSRTVSFTLRSSGKMAYPILGNEPRPSGRESCVRLYEQGENNSSEGTPTTTVCCLHLCSCYHLRDRLTWHAAAAAAAADAVADAPSPSCSLSPLQTISAKQMHEAQPRNKQRVRQANTDLNARRHGIHASRNEMGEDTPRLIEY